VIAERPPLLDAEAAARYLSCSRSTIYKLLTTGDLRGVKVGRSRRFTPSELQAYVERLTAEDAVERGAIR